MKRNHRGTPFGAASTEEVKRYEFTRNDSHGPSADDFRLDLAGEELLSSEWNKRAIECFVEAFIACGDYSCMDGNQIEKAFRTHLVQLQAQYRKLLHEPTQDDLDKEKLLARIQRRRGVGISFLNEHTFLKYHSSSGAAARLGRLTMLIQL